MKHLFLIASFSLVCFHLYSQDKKKEDEIETQVIEIIKDYNITVEESFKIHPNIIYNSDYQAKVNNTNLEYNLPDRIESFEFVPSQVSMLNYSISDTLVKGVNFLKLAFGSMLNPLVEWNHNIEKENKALQLNLKHHSAWRNPIAFQNYSNTNFTAKGAIQKEKWSFEPFIHLQNKNFNFFGNRTESIFQNSSNRFYSFGKLGIEIKRKTAVFKKLQWQGGGDVNYSKEDFNLGENTLKNYEHGYSIHSNFSYPHSKNLTLFLDKKIEIVQTNFSIQSHRMALELKPEIHYSAKTLKLVGALNIAPTSTNGNSELYFLPTLETEVQLVPNFVTLFSRWRRVLHLNSMNHWLNINPFANISGAILPISRVENREAGFKGSYNTISYNASISQKIIKDAVLFANDSINPRFLDARIEKNFTQTNIGLELLYKSPKNISTILKGNYFLYELDNLPVAYNLPSIIGDLGFIYSPLQKLSLQANVLFFGGVKSIIANKEVKTNLQVDLNIGGEYKLKENLYLVGMLNNIFDTRVQRFVGFPSFGFNAQAGIRWIY